MSDAVCDWPWATCLELSAIHSLWLPLLGLLLCRKNWAVHQGWFLPAPVQGEGQLKSPSSQRSILVVKVNHWYSLEVYLAAWLKLHRMGHSNPCGCSYCFPSVWCQLERIALHEQDGLCDMGNDSAQGSWWLFFQHVPRSICPKLSTYASSPLCPPSARAQGKWLQMQFCVLTL